jgi:hypothetical protein
MQGHWHLMDREAPWSVERRPLPTMQAVIHVKAMRAALGKTDPSVLFQTETPQACHWCGQKAEG